MIQIKLRYVFLTAAYCGIIFYLSSQSEPPTLDVSFPGADKVAHAVLYAGLAATLSLGIHRSNDAPNPSLHFVVPIVFAAVYGVSDEIHQIFVPERTFSLLDLAADAFGAGAIQVVLCFYVWKAAGRQGSLTP